MFEIQRKKIPKIRQKERCQQLKHIEILNVTEP